jgi:hypothetical protein
MIRTRWAAPPPIRLYCREPQYYTGGRIMLVFRIMLPFKNIEYSSMLEAILWVSSCFPTLSMSWRGARAERAEMYGNQSRSSKIFKALLIP